MKLTVLVDNSTIIDSYFLGEPGVSFFLEDGETSVLFDTGYSDAFMRNAAKLNVDPLRADYLVLSHGHIDHTGGLDPLLKECLERRLKDRSAHCPELLAHPAVFTPKLMEGLGSIGMSMSRQACSSVMKIKESAAPVRLSERLIFLGEIERKFDFESPAAIGSRKEPGGEVPDYLPDDTALAYVSDEGLVVITGCSHSGICSIVEQARRLTGVERVRDIIGGFHLLEPSEKQLEGTAEYLSTLQLPVLSACHCTDLQSKLRLSRAAPLKEVGSGMEIYY
ncbi:MAG: MBL fold metallo-hydrolase [Spirochaetia bacterium]